MDRCFFAFAAAGMCFLATSGMACGNGDDGGSGGSGGGDGGGAAGNGGSSSGGPDCSMSLCGCWESVTMTFDATVQDASTMMPLVGIELVCKGEATAIATSDAAGKLSFSIQTMSSPGCGFERCNNMTLRDPLAVHGDLDGTYYSFNGKTVSMP